MRLYSLNPRPFVSVDAVVRSFLLIRFYRLNPMPLTYPKSPSKAFFPCVGRDYMGLPEKGLRGRFWGTYVRSVGSGAPPFGGDSGHVDADADFHADFHAAWPCCLRLRSSGAGWPSSTFRPEIEQLSTFCHGLRHGFTLATGPTGTGIGQPLASSSGWVKPGTGFVDAGCLVERWAES